MGLTACSVNEKISLMNFMSTKSSVESMDILITAGLIDAKFNLTDSGFDLAKKIKSSNVNYKKLATKGNLSNVMSMLSTSLEVLQHKTDPNRSSRVEIYPGRNLYLLLTQANDVINELLARSNQSSETTEEIVGDTTNVPSDIDYSALTGKLGL